jgi:type I restriction enzyme S subunit
LGQRIELVYGRALKEEDREQGNVEVYGSNGCVGTHNVAVANGPSILIGRKGTIGAVHYAPRQFWPIDTVYCVVPKAGDNVKYLYYLLDYLLLSRLNAATGVPGLSRRDAYALRGAFPGPDEQTAIVRILDALGVALERSRAARDRAKALKRALSQKIFAQGLRGRPQQKTAIGIIPDTWTVLPVSSVVVAFQYGLSVPMETSGRTPILRMGNIQDGDVRLDDLKFVTLPKKTIDSYSVNRGDVLFNRNNSQEWVGKVGIYRHDAESVFASYLIRLLPDETKIDSYYLGHALQSYSAQCRIKRYAIPGVQQVNINATNLGKVLMPVPSGETGISEQREIASLLEAADAVVRSFQPVVEAQQALKKSLTHDLLSGRVRVNSLTGAKAA